MYIYKVKSIKVFIQVYIKTINSLTIFRTLPLRSAKKCRIKMRETILGYIRAAVKRVLNCVVIIAQEAVI